MKTLKLDEKEAVVTAISADDCYNGLVKLIEEYCQAREREVIKFSINSSNFNELAITKARAEGARYLAADLNRAFTELKKLPESSS